MQAYNPITEALERRSDAAWGRIFGVSRQSIAQWRKYNSIPRHFARVFAELTGVSVETQLEYDELMSGVQYDEFLLTARERAQAERIDRKGKRD